VDEVAAQIKRLSDTPLGTVANELETQLVFLHNAQCDHISHGQILNAFVSQANALVKLLPATFGNRFWFDAQMIDAIASVWNKGKQRLSGTIVPKSSNEWSHSSAFVTLGTGNEQRKSINVISFPGKDELVGIDLLTYPWLCHELAHNLFYYDDSLFIKCFTPKLASFLNTLRLRAIADHGSARTKGQAVIARIAEFWTPTLTHNNWSHEMAMDIVALWTCGPAFLAAFQDEIEDKGKNPYHVDKAHPPYALRAIALLKASRTLGWTNHTKDIRVILENWRKSKWAKGIDNNYRSLCDPQLTEAVLDCTLATCEAFGLTACTVPEIERIDQLLRQKIIPEFGAELIIAAWLTREQRDEPAYNQWQSSVVRNLSDSIMS
jgi:hypothetical protein